MKIMNRFVIPMLLAVLTVSVAAQSQDERVIHNNPDKYKLLSSVHAGAGQMGFTELIGRQALATNFLYLHAGVIQPKGGIGHHFHHNIEEMYVILDGEAEFTVNGRTSRLKAPAVVPCKMGDSHAIYNATNKPIRWLNFAVSTTKGRGDAFDLGDNRVGAAIEPLPIFVSSQLKRDVLKPGDKTYAGNGVLYRRVLGPEIFTTNWDYVDHVIVPAGSAVGPRMLENNEEVYYVMKGSGKITHNGISTAFAADDAFPGFLAENVTLSNDGKDDLELLIIGVAVSQQKKSGALQLTPGAMVLQMDFVVTKENSEAFEMMYRSIYVPAMTVQQGYLGSKLLRLFPENVAREIEAEQTKYNYQIQISFDTEENRRRWVASEQHKIAWPAATALSKEFKWRGYDVKGDDPGPSGN